MTRGSSPVLVGRGAELRRLRELVTGIRDAEHCVVLLSGEAGIGKSRLLTELGRSIGADSSPGPGPAVIRASCIEVGSTLAYLPIIELLDGLRRLGTGTPLEVDAGELRRSLGGTTHAGGQDDLVAAPAGRAAAFLRVHELLARAAAEHVVVAVIDDLQWADRSTLDVIAFLSRRLVGSGVMLLLAYRSDDLKRRHPLRPVLADLERHATLEHIRLTPLGPTDVAAQVAGILGREPTRDRLDRLVGLADGNPFHVEELLSLDDEGRLPPSLREVLDARLDQLDDSVRRVVDEAAVIGREFDPLLLASVSDAPRAEVAASLRSAADARILIGADDGRRYAFRHALLRDAVYEDLSPIERMEAHRRIAQALTDHPELGDSSPSVATADRARHWLAAGAAPEAFAALIEAARTATVATAWAEARAAFEGALSLWDRIADPEAIAESPRSAVFEQAAEIAWYEGDARRALALNRRAQSEPDVIADELRLGRLALREAGLLDDLGDLEGEGDAARRSFLLIPAEPPSIERAGALSRLGLHEARSGRVREAIEHYEQAIAMAERVGAAGEAAANRAFLAVALVGSGEQARAREVVLGLDGLLPTISEQLPWSIVATWAPWVWLALDEYAHAIDAADRVLLAARDRGLDRGVGLWCLTPRALAEFWLGRWDDALETIGRQGDYAWGIDAAVYLRAVAAQIAAGRGDLVRARSLAVEAIEISRPGFPEQLIVARAAAAWVELVDDHPEAAIDHVREAWMVASRWEGLSLRSLVLWIGLWAAADVATRSRLHDDDAARRTALELGPELVAGLRASANAHARFDPDRATSGPLLVLELAGAEAARLEGRDAAEIWAGLAGRFEALGDVPRTILARQRQAEAILRGRGDRTEALAALQSIADAAERIGAHRLRKRALAVAQAARLKVGSITLTEQPPAPAERSPWGLSGREREVLAMLVRGQTNRQIAEALFITDKTASVHVTNIMNKLGVSRRTEAAILALRAGIAADSVLEATESAPS